MRVSVVCDIVCMRGLDMISEHMLDVMTVHVCAIVCT